MSHIHVESKIETLIKPIINDLNYILYDIQYVKEGKEYYLRITIDNDNHRIGIEDCEKVNNAIDEILDCADIIKESYFLEVSSPGIERTLRKPWHFEKQIENEINVKLFRPIDKQKEFTGILKGCQDEAIELKIDEKVLKIDIKNIATAKSVATIF